MERPQVMPCVGCGVEFHPARQGPFPKYCSRQCKDKQPRERDPEKVRAYAKTSYERNREARLAKSKAWRAQNLDKHAAYTAAYRERHPEMREHAREVSRRHRELNKECLEEKRRAYRASEAGKKKEREYREATKAQSAERTRLWLQAYREANREEHREKMRAYYWRNPAKVLAKSHKRRARKAAAGGSYTAEEWQALLNVTGHKCLRCEATGIKLTADHVVPICVGGSSDISNIQPLCKACNSSKHKKIMDYRYANA